MKNYLHLVTRGTLVFLMASLVACPSSNNNGGGSGGGGGGGGGGGDANAYSIEIRFGASVSDAYKTVFNNAAKHWTQIITTKLSPPFVGTFDPATCGVDGFPSPATVTKDITIYAVVEPIDGEGGILGSAGPCNARDGSILPDLGTMRFDTADVDALANAGQLQETITHEMGHVLGIGLVWKLKGLLTGTGTAGECGDKPEFIGLNAVNAWHTLGGTGNVPVEGAFDKNGKPISKGTCEAHWRESVFTNELMTGFLDDGRANPLSKMTIASLKDMGYTVNLNADEAYTLGEPLINIKSNNKMPKAQMILLEPKFRWH
jgi:hypothetical protein